MKKLLVLLVSLVFLFWCFKDNNTEDIEKAKDDILNGTISEENTETWDLLTSDENLDNIWNTDLEEISENEEWVVINPISTWKEALIEIEDLSSVDLYSWEFYIKWKTLKKVDKIIVNFSNETSTYPPDTYTLKEFKAWDDTFKYMASDRFKTLDYWLNTYIFSAYAWDEVYKIKVEINIPEKNESNLEENEDEEIEITPASWDINTQKKDLSDVNCENLTDYLVKNYWYVYWSQCRDIKKDKSIWYFVLRLKWESYYFEKHYVDYDKQEYSVLPLDTWSWVTKENISEKIQEFASQTWEKVTENDKLFK